MIVSPITLNERDISVRARSKKELYRILQLEADVYLPPMPQSNHEYVAGVLSGTIKVSLQCRN